MVVCGKAKHVKRLTLEDMAEPISTIYERVGSYVSVSDVRICPVSTVNGSEYVLFPLSYFRLVLLMAVNMSYSHCRISG